MLKKIQVQDKEITVVPQKHARLRHRLSSQDFSKLATADYAGETYRLLDVLVPDLKNHFKPYEWEGFTSQTAMENDEYDEDNDPSPTTAEIVDLFEAAIQVNGADRLGKILDLVKMGQQGQARQIPSSGNASPTVESPVSAGNSGA